MTPATREHAREIELPLEPQAAFELLIRPSAIRAWWSATRVVIVPRQGGVWAAVWGADEDDPDFVTTAKIEVFDPPQRMLLCDYDYLAKTGPLPFDADFRTEFSVRPAGEGRSIVRVVQAGFPAGPEADDFYAGCEVGWRDTLAALQAHAQSLVGHV